MSRLKTTILKHSSLKRYKYMCHVTVQAGCRNQFDNFRYTVLTTTKGILFVEVGSARYKFLNPHEIIILESEEKYQILQTIQDNLSASRINIFSLCILNWDYYTLVKVHTRRKVRCYETIHKIIRQYKDAIRRRCDELRRDDI